MNKNVLLIVVLFFCLSSQTQTAQNTNQNSDVNYTINEAWKFSKQDSADSYKVDFSDKEWPIISLPHTWNNEDAVDETPGFFRGSCWYRRAIFIGNEAIGKQVILNFEGANQVVELFLNGKFVGKHIGGYTAFNFNITSFIQVGKPNLIAIKVDNSYNPSIPPLTADFTFFGGIYRDLSLKFLSPIHISKDDFASSGVYIRTPEVSDKEAIVEIETIVKNTLSEKKSIRIIQKYIGPDGQILEVKSSELVLNPKESRHFISNKIKVLNPKLWSPDSPNLYKVVTSIIDMKTEKTLDESENSFGLRWFKFTADKGFYLNGKSLKLIGVNRHEIFEGLGNALRDEFHIRDMKLIKEMGSNFLRIAHYPQDPYILNLCDQLGIIAMVEIPIVNAITETDAFLNNSLFMAEEMVKQNFNHPSLVTWAYMNEVMLRPPFKKDSIRHITYSKEVNRQAKAIEKLIRSLDTSRYTLIPFHGSMSSYKEAGLFDVPKIIGWNLYQGWYSGSFSGFDKFLDNYHNEYPNIPIIITEYGADVDSRLHSFSPKRFDYTAEYGDLYHQHYLKTILERDFISGAAIWNLSDFYSEERASAVPHVNNKGITGLNRETKDTYLLYQAHFLKKAFIAIGSKLWTNRAGVANQDFVCFQKLNIFSNLPKVEVRHNGNDLGSFPVTNGFASIDIPFTNGTNILYASAKFEGKEVEDFYKTNFLLLDKQLKNSKIPFSELNVMLGSERYFEDKLGQICWIPEQAYTNGGWGFIGGYPFTTKTKYGELPASELDILNTSQDPIFQTQRVDIKEFKADVTDGTYEVYLYWAHLVPSLQKEALAYNLGNTAIYEKGQNYAFDVFVNGNKFLQNFDVPNQIGAERSIIKKVQVNASSGKGISIKFEPTEGGKTYLNSIRIVKIN